MPRLNVRILRLRACAAAALCFFLVRTVCADPGAGTTAANFLKIPAAVIPTALAETYTALIGPDSILYNPAGLGLLSYSAFSGTHNRYLEEINQEYAALAFRSKYGTIGGAFSMVNSGKIEAYDANDMVIGETSTRHQLWMLSFSQSWPRFRRDIGKLDPMVITPSWSKVPEEKDYRPKTYRASLGFSVKKVIEELDNMTDTVYACDAGGMLVLPRHFQIGASILNFAGPKQRFVYESYSLPQVLRAGIAKDFHTVKDMVIFTVATDVVKYSDAKSYNTVGIEADIMRLFQVRAGYRSRRDIGPSLSGGFGLNFDKFTERGIISGARIDYSYMGFGDLGTTHRFGLQFIW